MKLSNKILNILYENFESHKFAFAGFSIFMLDDPSWWKLNWAFNEDYLVLREHPLKLYGLEIGVRQSFG